MQPGVRRAAAVVREDRPGDKRIVGYILADKNNGPDLAKIRSNVGLTLPDYMVPNLVVVVDEFPYTPSGKLDRKSFAPPSTKRPNIETEFVKPKTNKERELAKIWCEVLQLDEVGTQDNFFDLGGNSIRAVKVVAQAKQAMKIDVTGAEFFDNPVSYTHLTLPTIYSV